MKKSYKHTKEQILYSLRNAQFKSKHPKIAVFIDVLTVILLLIAAVMLLAYFILRFMKTVNLLSAYSATDWEGFIAIIAILLTITFILSFFFKKEKQGKADFAYTSKLITLSSGIMAILFWVYVIVDSLL